MSIITLDDIHVLCWRFVPRRARHPLSLGTGPNSFWPAHELGHYLTVPVQNIHLTMFGIDDDSWPKVTEHEQRCYELAAMHVSQRLLEGVGCDDLALEERELTDWETMHWNDHGRVRAILREKHVVQVPLNLERLVVKLSEIRQAAEEHRRTP